MALPITITDAGRAEIINAQNTGTGPVTITEIGFGTGQYTPTKTRTALQAQIKRVSSIAGQAVAADTIHVTALDESSAAYNVGEFGLFSDKGTLIAVYSQPAASGWIIQKAGASTLLLATDIILESLNATSITFGDVSFINPPATTTVQGVVELATPEETQAGTDGTRAVTPVGLKSLTASTSRPGLVQLNDTLTSSSTSQALTAAQGKKLQDEKQPKDPTLTALAALATAVNQMIYSTGPDTFAMAPLTAFARSLLDDLTAADALATLGAAPLNSPGLTGTPTVPTPAAGANTTQIANTAFVQAAISALVNSSPAALDTLKELATALGNDPNFATTMTNALAEKAPLASPVLTGDPKAPTPASTDNDTSVATTAFVRAAMALFGIGGTTPAIGSAAAADYTTANGIYIANVNDIGNPGGLAGVAGYLFHIRGAAAATQKFYTASMPARTFERLYASGAWSAWQEIWHTGNLVKQTDVGDLTAGRMVLTETVRRRLSGGFFNTYCDRLILLHPLYTSAFLPYSIVDGKITATRGAANAVLNQTVAEVVSSSAYNSHATSLYDLEGNPAGAWQAVSCTYQGLKYAALIVPYTASAYNGGIFFEGRAVGDANQLLCIEYYNRQTATVLNAEVYNSIEPLSVQKTLRVGGETVWHTGNVSAFIQTLLDDADAETARATLGANNASNLNTGTVPLAQLPTAIRNLTQGSTVQDPNSAVDPVILSNHANTPNSGFYWHITTTFYSSFSATANRGQIAVSYQAPTTQVWARSCFGGAWTPWVRCDGIEVAPPGKTAHFAMSTAPLGWLKANGAAVSRTAYAALFSAIGTMYGAGDGSTTFNLPDMRGEFVRGWDDGRGVDSGRVFGSAQSALSPDIPRDGWGTSGSSPSSSVAITAGRLVVGSGAGESSEVLESLRAAGGNISPLAGDNRPRNIALLACIKY